CGPLCVLFICVLCEKKNIFETRRGVLSLTEHTEFTEFLGTHFDPTWRWPALKKIITSLQSKYPLKKSIALALTE
ncbi:hypothetical protein, partial [Prevotella jejuni]|uniref:hypothetical protein n=1 Tax=Prevotella jejuni TaxID=1177574 RepID=UPI00321192C2